MTANKIYHIIEKQILRITIVQAFFLPFNAKYNPAKKNNLWQEDSSKKPTVTYCIFIWIFFVEIFTLDNIFKLPSRILISESNPAATLFISGTCFCKSLISSKEKLTGKLLIFK